MNKLNKVFVEAIHNKSITLSGQVQILNNIIDIHGKEFPDVNMKADMNAIQLTNTNKNQMMFIDQNRIVIDCDNPEGLSQSVELFKRVIKELCNVLGIECFQRVGIRCFYEKKFSDYEEAVQTIRNKFVKLDQNQLSKFGDNIHNINIGFISIVDGFKVNQQISTVIGQEINVENARINANTSYGIMCDIDFFKDEEINSEKLSLFLDKGASIIPDIKEQYHTILGGN